MTPTPNPHDARQAPPPAAVGAKDAARQGVPSVVRPDPPADDGRRPTAELHIVAPPDWRVTPSARSWCSCGRERSAIGRAAVLRLVADHTEHRNNCPRLNRNKEGGKTA